LPIILAAILPIGLTACQNLAGPNWGSPGSAGVQMERAERFDPYPENEAGPAIEGARPLDFQVPPAEVKRSRRSPAEWGF